MAQEEAVPGWPGRVAVAVTHSEPPRVFVAEDHFVLSRVLALELVAHTDPDVFSHEDVVAVRSALLDERWADAVVVWMDATGESVDAYPDEDLWTADRMTLDRASMEIRMGRVFRDPPSDGPG